MRNPWAWAPAMILCVGAALVMGVDRQTALSLVRPLSEVIPDVFEGYRRQEISLSDAEVEGARVSDYLQRLYERPAPDTTVSHEEVVDPPGFSLYI